MRRLTPRLSVAAWAAAGALLVWALLAWAAPTSAADAAEPAPESSPADPAVVPSAGDPTGPGWPAGPPREGEELERLTAEVAGVMRCPVCQGLSVADSPSEAALAMREEIRELLSRGYSSEQVLAYFERSYGEFVRLEPKAEGFNWAVWLAPPAVLLIGIGVVAWRLRAARAQPQAATSESETESETGPAGLDRYLDRVREEVSR